MVAWGFKKRSPARTVQENLNDAGRTRGRGVVKLRENDRHDLRWSDAGIRLTQFHRNVATPASDFTGAMAITNSAPHEFDVVRHVLGTEYAWISAFQPKRSDRRVAPVLMVLETVDGQLVNIEINNNAAYGYDVRAELVGEQASISMSHVAYTHLERSLGVHTGYDADWRTRYFDAYRRQNRAFLRFVDTDVFPEIASSCWDGYAAAVAAEAGVTALASGQKQVVTMISKPEFYA